MKKIIFCSILFFGNVHGFSFLDRLQPQDCGQRLLRGAVYPGVLVVQGLVLNKMDSLFDWNCTEQEADTMIKTIYGSSLCFSVAIDTFDTLSPEARVLLTLFGLAINVRAAVNIKRARMQEQVERRKRVDLRTKKCPTRL